MKPELAVFGGSFDPPHLGHVMLATYALSMSSVERVLVIPVYAHAFGKTLSDFDHRLAMCERAFENLKRVEVSPIERELGGLSRTLRLVQALAQRYPGYQLRILIGADILEEAHNWLGFEDICALAPLLVAGRGGYAHPSIDPQAPVLPDISSTAIRTSLAKGGDVSSWVPARVCAYIEEHGLYREVTAP